MKLRHCFVMAGAMACSAYAGAFSARIPASEPIIRTAAHQALSPKADLPGQNNCSLQRIRNPEQPKAPEEGDWKLALLSMLLVVGATAAVTGIAVSKAPTMHREPKKPWRNRPPEN